MSPLTPTITVLGPDCSSVHRLNCNSFQQSALLSWRCWQYSVFYTSSASTSRPPPVSAAASTKPHLQSEYPPRHVNVARRRLGEQQWETITLADYEQVIDDGHNTISLGICEGDGTVHVAFDAHCEGLNYRVSRPGVASAPERWDWVQDGDGDGDGKGGVGFSEVMHELPGAEESGALLGEMTYPRCLSVDGGELVFECRVGKAGMGSAVMFRYGKTLEPANRGEGERSGKWAWRFVGMYLVGEGCNPYINGLSFVPGRGTGAGKGRGRIHATWTNRHFVEYEDETGEAHKQQAGPNGPENNADLGYAWSGDGGWVWCRSGGDVAADLRRERMKGVKVAAEEMLVKRIPRNSGIENQEGQCVDGEGVVSVLMRNNREGRCEWRHHWRDVSGEWVSDSIEGLMPRETGRRGKVVADGSGSVYFVVPGNVDDSLTVLRRKAVREDGCKYGKFEVLWKGHGYDGEPLVDEALLVERAVLSVMTRTSGEGRSVAVLDFAMDSPA